MTNKLLIKITEKWPAKVLSVAAAIIISIFYRMNTLETRVFTAPVNIDENNTLVAANSFTNDIKISFRGESNGIHSILEEDIEAYIDLSRYAEEGTYRVPVQIRKKGSALGVEPLEISVLPVNISIRLERKVIESVPVFPSFRGTVADGHELTEEIIIPQSVFAEGPRSIIENLMEFNTETIDLERRSVNFSVLVNIINNNPRVRIHGNQMIEYHAVINRIERAEREAQEISGEQ